MNATGFRKILKKWDKRSKSSTKELYLARQVDIQPVFDRQVRTQVRPCQWHALTPDALQLISELSDTVAACLVDITDVSSGLELEGAAVSDLILNRQISNEGNTQMGLFRDLESNLRKAVLSEDQASVRSLVVYSDTLGQQHWGKGNITRILWRAVVDAPAPLADLILSTSTAFDYQFVDDINGRTCLHEAAVSGALRLVDLCLAHDVKPDVVDVYGRSAFHYAAMHGHVDVCKRLLQVKVSPYVRDMENYSPLVYATLKGSVDCVRVLLEEGGVPAQPTPPDGDLLPLALASLAGHLDVVLLLLEHGALSLPSSNGEYPIHFAARQGHADICRLLVRYDGWDVPDKYNEWTPLFHAGRHGHDDCVDVLLMAGANPFAVDELGKTPVYHASWFGHVHCTNRLLQAMHSYNPFKSPSGKTSFRPPNASVASKSPNSDTISPLDNTSMGGTDTDLDADMIPSLSLPPPIMPFRIYGHNYLDNTYLVQVVLGHPFTSSTKPARPPVHLLPSVARQTIDLNCVVQPIAPSFKLVITSRPDEGGPAMPLSHSIILPLADQSETFTFQVPSLDDLILEFSVYPTFGSKPIGRAIQSPHTLRDLRHENVRVIPVLDHRLHLIGEVLNPSFPHQSTCVEPTLESP